MIPLKVAIIDHIGGHGGTHYYSYGLATGLVNSGVDVILYTSEETHFNVEINFGLKKSFKNIWIGNKLAKAIKYIFCLISSLVDAKKNNVNIVHFHFYHYASLEKYSLLLARFFKFKIVVTAHDVESFHGKRDANKARYILLIADKVIAHNQVSFQALTTKILIPQKHIEIIPHGNYINLISDPPTQSIARYSLGLPSSNKIILFFGQIKKVKGLDILLEAFSHVVKDDPHCTLLIAGKVWKDDWSVYKNIIDKYKLSPNVIEHIRFIPDKDVPNYYRSADLIVLPYREIYQSGVLLMAMSFKTPVLASNILGMTEVITDGHTGLIFEKNDVVDLSHKIKNSITDINLLNSLSTNAYLHMKNNNDWNLIGLKSSSLYRSIV